MQITPTSAFNRTLPPARTARPAPALSGLRADRFIPRFGNQDASPDVAPAPFQVDLAKVDRIIQNALYMVKRAETPEQKIRVTRATWHVLPKLASASGSKEQQHTLQVAQHNMRNVGSAFDDRYAYPYQKRKAWAPDFEARFADQLPIYRQYLEDTNLLLQEGMRSKPVRYIWGRIKPSMEALAKDKGIQLNISGEAMLEAFESPLLHSNGEDVYTLLINLVQNALKYTPPQGQVDVGFSIIRKVAPGKADEAPHLQITVADTGLGFPPEEVAAALYGERGATAIQSGIPGTGFGLKNVYHVIRYSHGDIQVKSPLNPGTAFPGTRITCRIPLCRSTWTPLPQIDLDKADRIMAQGLRLLDRAKTPKQKLRVTTATWRSLRKLLHIPVAKGHQLRSLMETKHHCGNIIILFSHKYINPTQAGEALPPAFEKEFTTQLHRYRHELTDFNMFLREDLYNQPLRSVWSFLKPKLQAEAEQKGIQLNVSGEEMVNSFETPLYYCTGEDMYNAMAHLVQNALQSTPPQGQVNVAFSQDQTPHPEEPYAIPWLQIAVEDTGSEHPSEARQGIRTAPAEREDSGFSFRRAEYVTKFAIGECLVDSPLHPNAASPGKRITCRFPAEPSAWVPIPPNNTEKVDPNAP